MSKETIDRNRNLNIGVWIVCKNPNCSNTDNSDHVFFVEFSDRKRQYCSASCASTIKMKKNRQNPEFNAKLAKITSKAARERITTPKMRESSSRKMKEQWKNPEFVAAIREGHRTPEHKKYLSDRFVRMQKDPEFLAAIREGVKNKWKDPEYIKIRSKLASETHQNNIKNGRYGWCQRLLFEKLDKEIPHLFFLEVPIVISEDSRRKYNCNHKWYSIDIAYKINNTILLAIEVDGKMGHSSEEEILKDNIRDKILWDEFKIATLRVTNKSIKASIDNVIDEIKYFIFKNFLLLD